MSFLQRTERLLSPYVVLVVTRSGAQAATFLAMLVAIRSVKVETFGAFSVAWTATVIANAVVYAGFVQYLLRARDLDTAKPTSFWLLLGEGALFSLAMLIAAAVVRVLGNAMVATSLLVLAPVPLLTAACAWADALLTRAHRPAAVSVTQFAAELAGGAALVLGIWLGSSLAALLAWRLTSSIANFVGLMLLHRERPRFVWSTETARESLHTALPLQGTMLVLSLAGYAAEFLLAGQLNTAVSGGYRAANRIALTATSVFLSPMGALTWTALAEHERAGNTPGMQRSYAEQLRLMSFLAWPMLLCLALSSERLFSVIARPDWSGAGPVLQLIAIARAADVLTFFMEPVLVCTARASLFFRLRGATVLVLLIGVAATSRHGALAVSEWQLVYNALYGVLAVEVVCRTIQLPRFAVVRAVAPSLATAGLCLLAGELSYRLVALAELWRLGISITAMGLCMGLCLLTLIKRGAIRLPKR